jgi:hypothetical protein
VVSDAGFGITKSGWGAPQPPPPPKNCTASCDDNSVCTTDQLINPPCTCQNTPANEGASCGGAPGKDSCKENGKCEGGACAEGTNKPAGTGCDDNIFCSDPDQCDAGGACKGTKIEDKEGPNFTFEAKFGDIENGLKSLASLFGSDAKVGITGSVEASEKDICCEAKQQKDVPVKKAKVSFNAKLETPKIFVPSLSFDIRAVRLGVFVKFGVSAAVAIEGENDFCEGNGVCWKGGITLAGSVEGGVAAEDAAKIVSISASCVTGLQFDANVSCKEYQIALSHSGFKCKINIELFDGFVAFGVEKELIAPGPLIGGGPKPLPSF